MDHLSQAQRDELRKALLDERARVGTRIDADAAAAAPNHDIGDIQDGAAEQMRRRQALDRSARDVGRAEEIEAALRRMDEGSYGICEETGEEIPFGRLKLEPTTRYTVEALELLESERARERLTGDTSADEDGTAY